MTPNPDRLAQLEGEVEAAERMAQELGWPGYSQGGNPVSYLYNLATERDTLQVELASAKEHFSRCIRASERDLEQAEAELARVREALQNTQFSIMAWKTRADVSTDLLSLMQKRFNTNHAALHGGKERG